MDHMRISGTEPSSVIKYPLQCAFKKLKNQLTWTSWWYLRLKCIKQLNSGDFAERRESIYSSCLHSVAIRCPPHPGDTVC